MSKEISEMKNPDLSVSKRTVRSYLNTLFIICTVFISSVMFAQDTLNTVTPGGTIETAEVKFIAQWPSKEKSSSVSDWVKKVVLGEKTPDLSKPISVISSDSNYLWILDQGNKAVFKIYGSGSEKTLLIRNKKINLPSLVGICNFGNDKILFTDSYLNKIFVADKDRKEFKVLNDTLKLDQPTGIAYNPQTEEIWVVETAAHKITVLSKDGTVIRTIGKRGIASGEFNYPTSIWIDKLGNAYIIDAMNFRVQVLNKDGEVVSVFGTTGDASGYFARPKGIATDSYGNIYVTDALFHSVQIFDMHGNFLYKFGTQGHEEGQFWMPSGIYIDAKDNIYIADSYNSRVQIFQLTNCKKK